MDYKEALAYLENLSVFGIRLGLERIRRLLSLLEEPQNRYRTVHVTGTNGKGSVCAMVAGILRNSSIRTGLYISPHLVSYTERIQVDGQPISEQEFADCLGKVKVYVDQMEEEGAECPTQFEVLTAVAFLYFAMRHVEYAVIEVGLGGLLDSTNVIRPEVSVITNVAFEHADKCGGTLEGIAHHKAGIIKEGVPVVTGAGGDALGIIRREAELHHADIFVEGEDFQSKVLAFDSRMQKLEFTSHLIGRVGKEYELSLLGEHQVQNSAIALMAAVVLHHQDRRVTPETIRKALRVVSWPGRFELVKAGSQEILLDGAHNPAGMESLRRSLDRYFPAKPRVFLLGILRDKEIGKMLETLIREEDVVIVTEPFSERAASVEDVAAMARRQSHDVEAYAGMEDALKRAMELAGGNYLLVAAGSLYLIGSLRAHILLRKGGDL